MGESVCQKQITSFVLFLSVLTKMILTRVVGLSSFRSFVCGVVLVCFVHGAH